MDPAHAPEVVPSQEAPQVYYPGTKDHEHVVQKPEKRILGLRVATFWLLLALFLVIVVAAVGGGVGGSLAVKHAKSQAASENGKSSSTTTPSGSSTTSPGSSSTPTSSTPSPPGTTTSGDFVVPTDVMLPLECDNKTPSVTVNDKVYKFNATCGVDHPKGDLLPIVAYSLHDCLTACAKYNSKWGDDGCAGVVFGSDLVKYVKQASGNCYLKNSTSSDAQADGVVAAVLMSSQ